MIASDEEVRRAAERVALAVRHVDEGMSEGESFEIVYGDQCGQFREDMRSLANGVLAELDRRDQEAAERALPIDEEWLASIGFDFNGLRLRRLLSIGHYELSASPHADDMLLMQDDDAIAIPHITTRGQLLDLLAALKGGAS